MMAVTRAAGASLTAAILTLLQYCPLHVVGTVDFMKTLGDSQIVLVNSCLLPRHGAILRALCNIMSYVTVIYSLCHSYHDLAPPDNTHVTNLPHPTHRLLYIGSCRMSSVQFCS